MRDSRARLSVRSGSRSADVAMAVHTDVPARDAVTLSSHDAGDERSVAVQVTVRIASAQPAGSAEPLMEEVNGTRTLAHADAGCCGPSLDRLRRSVRFRPSAALGSAGGSWARPTARSAIGTLSWMAPVAALLETTGSGAGPV